MRRVDPAPMLALDAVTVIWPGRKAGAPGYCAVKDVTFAVEPGEFLSLVGPTGCGKSALLNVAAGLILEPHILLMDGPFGALDVQTRHLMENELLELWSAECPSVIFITHDLEEAISLSDRVILLSAGPATRPIGEFRIDLPRPRDVA